MSVAAAGSVLVVDDNEVDRESVRRMLAGSYEVIEAATAAEGLERCLAERPGVVLLDYRLPDRGGLEALSDLLGRGAPVIMLTGQGDETVAVASLRAGAADYLVKSALNEEVLLRAVTHALEHDALRKKVRAAEAAAQMSEARYRTLFESSLAGIYVATPQGVVLDCNPALARMLGFGSVREVVERGETSLRVDPERYGSLLRRLNAEGVLPLFESRMRGADGRVIHVLESTVGVFDGDELHEVYGYLVDVTERKRAELERSLLAEAVRQAAEAIIITETDGTIRLVNHAFERMSGYDAAEVVGQTPRILRSGEHDEARYRELWGTILGGGTWSGRMINRRRDGTLYEVDSTISAVLADDGTIARFMAFQKDVTREVELERQLHAVQRLETVGHLAGGIAHDFNNLMTVVLTNAELMLEATREEDPFHQHLREVKQSAMAGRALTKQLLAFGRRQVLHPKVLDLNSVARQLGGMIARVLGDDIDLRVRLGADIGNVRADPAQLQSVMLNLALNARDAMPDGGILMLETSEVHIDDVYLASHPGARAGRFVVLSMTDTGVGMDDATLERIFEPFFTTKRDRGGSGMGLAMVYGIVKQSGGNIWVYSEPGEGTTFKVYLPAVEEPIEKQAAPVAEATVASGPILFVEDNHEVRRSVKRILEATGHVVAAFGDPALALAHMTDSNGGFEVVITDMVMPGMNGLELAERLAEVTPSVRVLFLSGYSAEVAFKGRKPTVRHSFLEKPFTHDELVSAVRSLSAAR